VQGALRCRVHGEVNPARTARESRCDRHRCAGAATRYILRVLGYTEEGAVTKRRVDIADGTLDRAKLILGPDTIKDTVNAALLETVRAAERRQHVDRDARRHLAATTKHLADDDVMAEAWR